MSKTKTPYQIDSHKLIYHPQRVAAWLSGKPTYPLYVEISPFGGCNHRCIFCALDYLEYKPQSLEIKVLKKFLREIAARGAKSVMFAGEGEPLLYRDLPEAINYAHKSHLDLAVTTNGVHLSPGLLKKMLPKLKWLRISLNAGSARTYCLVHRTRPEDFKQVINNIKQAVRLKKSKGYSCTIGVQFLLLNQNYREAETITRLLKGVGVDYLIVKPYSQHPASRNRLKKQLDYRRLLFLEQKLTAYTDQDFKLIFRKRTTLKINRPRPYSKCLAFPFWAYLTSWGDLYACSAFLGDRRFCYGNIYQQPFAKIWQGKQSKKIKRMMQTKWKIEDCRELCRLDEANRYLWDLHHPAEHVNFI